MRQCVSVTLGLNLSVSAETLTPPSAGVTLWLLSPEELCGMTFLTSVRHAANRFSTSPLNSRTPDSVVHQQIRVRALHLIQ